MCKRAPLYLRAVVNDKGGTDALDMPSDTPTDGYRNACGLDAALEGWAMTILIQAILWAAVLWGTLAIALGWGKGGS